MFRRFCSAIDIIILHTTFPVAVYTWILVSKVHWAQVIKGNSLQLSSPAFRVQIACHVPAGAEKRKRTFPKLFHGNAFRYLALSLQLELKRSQTLTAGRVREIGVHEYTVTESLGRNNNGAERSNRWSNDCSEGERWGSLDSILTT